jgi:hypothetical protein
MAVFNSFLYVYQRVTCVFHGFFLAGDQKSKDEAFGLMAGPNTPEGRRICVFGVGVSLPAAAQDHLANYW